MKNRIFLYVSSVLLVLIIGSCQKMERPALGNYPKDPPVPPYNSVKSFWAFENNVTDAGENKLNGTASNLTYVAGITGQAMKVNAGGYLVLPVLGQINTDPNGFVSVPADTLKNLKSFTVSFWMKATGPFTDGAQGVFAISHKTQFWGNLEIFLENYNNAADQTEAFIKVHMFNAGVASGNGEEWNEIKVTNVFNKWTHIGLTYNEVNSQFTLYVDGLPTTINNKVLGGGNYGKIKYNDFNGIVLGSFAFQTAPSLTNHGPEAWAKSLNGSLDQFRILNKYLTAAEMLALFTSKL